MHKCAETHPSMAAQTDWQQRALAAEAEVKRLRTRNRELGDELDLLALANADLRSLAAPAAPAPAPAGPPIDSFPALRVHGACRALHSEPDRTVEQATGAANATCVALHGDHGFVMGGADGVVRLHRDGKEPVQHACGSPPLRLAFSPDGCCVAAGCMDGSVRFLTTDDLCESGSAEAHLAAVGASPAAAAIAAIEAEEGVLSELFRKNDHEARIVAVAWGAPCGEGEEGVEYLATCARDKTVVIYDANMGDKLHTLVLPTNPESLCFAGSTELIVYCRGEPFRRHIDCASTAETRVSLNANDWDTHCSFAVLDMAVSPDGTYLVCATDTNKHVVYPLRSNEHARVLVGHSADEYANARIAWLGDASVVSNSQDPGLYQWDIGSGKVLTRVERAHAKSVRDLAVFDGALATCSFDKAAKLWSLAA